MLFNILLWTTLFGFVMASKNHAVLIAGSNGYDNYRHQADICHAYNILSNKNIDNIILMTYDDIANNPENPFPGKIFNSPSTIESPATDLYENCQKAKNKYTGDDVNADNFLAVLTGNQSGVPKGKKVLDSTEEDHVFINFADHGGPGILEMPSGPFLYKSQLQNALQIMYEKKMYKSLVFYIEACESGSIFDGFDLGRLNIYVVTAANSNQPSYGTYCPPNDYVYYNNQYKPMNTCLGDLFSVNWMENADKINKIHSNETLETQYEIVKKETNLSNPQQFGELSITSEGIQLYEGNGYVNTSRNFKHEISINQWAIPSYLKFYKNLRKNKSNK